MEILVEETIELAAIATPKTIEFFFRRGSAGFAMPTVILLRKS